MEEFVDFENGFFVDVEMWAVNFENRFFVDSSWIFEGPKWDNVSHRKPIKNSLKIHPKFI